MQTAVMKTKRSYQET